MAALTATSESAREVARELREESAALRWTSRSLRRDLAVHRVLHERLRAEYEDRPPVRFRSAWSDLLWEPPGPEVYRIVQQIIR